MVWTWILILFVGVIAGSLEWIGYRLSGRSWGPRYSWRSSRLYSWCATLVRRSTNPSDKAPSLGKLRVTKSRNESLRRED